ncbi:NFACT family protein [Candidatus Bathyarchaeota archaeon]|nr:NFACT family protein [Candidatus Bathyarchaeota archaeon]
MPKKEFTSFDMAAVIRESKEDTLNSRVNNIYQLDDKTFLFKLHKTEETTLSLILEAGRRLHLTSYILEKPKTPPAFCMALRKYLRGGRFTDIKQHEFERVAILSFGTKNGKLQLVLELFGDGNIILVDENGKILQALNYRRMRDRNILRSEVFKFPPSSGKNPLKATRGEFQEGLKDFADVEVVRAIARLLGIGGLYAEEALARAKVEKTKLCSTLGEGEINAVFGSLQSLLLQVVDGVFEPLIVLDNAGDFVDVVPFRLQRYETAEFKLRLCSSFNEALDEFYVRLVTAEKAVAGIEVDKLKREADRFKRIIAEQENALTEAKGKAERDRLIGDTIYAHSVELQALLDRFSRERQAGKEWKTIISEILAEKHEGLKPAAFSESLDTRNLMINVCRDNLTFNLDLRRTLFENAAEFYERGKRARQKGEGATAALDDSRRKLLGIEARIAAAENLKYAGQAKAEEDLTRMRVRHKEWFEKFRWFLSSDGFLVVGGKDAVTNEVLIKKYAEKSDTVFHADIIGAPFVVIKTQGKEASEKVLQETAEFSAAFSRGWREGFGNMDTYWVKPEQLSKSGPSGESVPHGAFVVTGKRNWMRNIPLRTMIGVVIEHKDHDEDIRVVGGPFEAVKAKTNAYVAIAPGDNDAKELTKRILKILTDKMPAESRERKPRISIENIREFIPFSKGRILES